MERTSTSTTERFDDLSEGRRELLKLLLDEGRVQSDEIQVCSRGDGVVRLPTSLAQQRLWFIDQLEAGGAGYIVTLALRLRGVLHEKVIEMALDALVRRHEVLRTVFRSVDGEPVQEISPEGSFVLKIIDLRDERQAELEAQVRLNQAEEVNGKFDLLIGPLIRGRLLRLQDEEHVLLVTMHHIVADGWSKGVLIRELAALYRGFLEGRCNPLTPLPIQYADYAQWQRRQWSEGEALDKQLSYWHARLEGATPQLELPTDRPRPVAQSHRGATVPLMLDAQLTMKLKDLAQKHGVTLFMVLFAGWAILLSRLSGQEDVVVGTPVANRQRPETEGLIGIFVNALALRVGVLGDLCLKEFLAHVKEVTLGAYDNQDTPFEKIVEMLQPQRVLNRNPIFQVMFVLHNWPKDELSLPGLTVAIEDEVDEPAILDCWIALEERAGKIVGGLNYSADLFDRETVRRWTECFRVLLRGMVDGPETRIARLPILTEQERDQVLQAFNATNVAYPHDVVLHQLFEESVRRTPNALAVVCEERRLTYAELNERANQLARYLRGKGVGPDRFVGLCVEPGLDLVIGFLGILKAGGAYVPLDPSYPRERLAYILNDAAPLVLLTQSQLIGTLPSSTASVIALDSGWDVIAAHDRNNLDRGTLTSRHLAYVIYTSGSTGVPKGVAAEHRSMVSRISAHRSIAPFSDRDVCCHKTSVGFVDAIFEILGPLSYGLPLVVAPTAVAKDARQLASLVAKMHITQLVIVPTFAQSILEDVQAAQLLGGLRSFTLSGEEVSAELMCRLQERLPNCTFINLYGSSEVGPDASCHIGRKVDYVKVPIGRPIENARIYVLDRYMQPVPIGVTGEIYVGGAGLARGYLNRPELTAERFIADPFSHEPEARLYRSGDLGRWRSDGEVDYFGRNDRQVKIRGFRIELGEIESQLARHPQVKEVAVLAREDVEGEKVLVAYATQRDGVELRAEALRAHLKTTLPHYMVPSAFVILDRLPLTQTGKLDRRALPEPAFGAGVEREYEAPMGEVEMALAEIWQQLLRVQSVGRRDDFFELGGHSLHAMKMIAQVSERFAVSLSAVAVFKYPTIQQMSEAVEALLPVGGRSLSGGEMEFDEGVV